MHQPVALSWLYFSFVPFSLFLYFSVCMTLSASWLSQAQLQQLLTPVRNLIGQLVATSSLEQFHPLLLLLREGLDGSKVTEGNHRVSAALAVSFKTKFDLIT